MKAIGLIFDLDGTLIDSDQIYRDCLLSVGIGPESVAYTEARRQTKSNLGEGNVSAHNRLLYLKRMLEDARQFSASKTLDLMDAYETAVSAAVTAQWRALGRAKLMTDLAKTFPMVVLTNENTRTQLIKMRAMDPAAAYFKQILTSEELGVEKPHPKTFQSAAKILGLPLQECWMIGDDLRADILPAHELGLRTAFSCEFRQGVDISPNLPSATAVLATLNELPALLRGTRT